MEAMKIDRTTTIRAELKTMVTESTKAAVKDVRAEMKDYMANKPPHQTPHQEIMQDTKQQGSLHQIHHMAYHS
eukprot:13839763-Ditylum_brightwellii.AAC.1